MAFTYRTSVFITKSTAGDLTDYPELVTLDTATLIAASKMQSDCDDLQFTTTGGTTLKHWVMPETKNTSTTRIFVKIPTVTGSATTEIYMYYGDGSMANAEDGTNTFTFFDDFTTGGGSSLNAGRWTDSGSNWTEQTGPPTTAQSTATGTEAAYTTSSYTRAKRIIMRWKQSAITSTGNHICMFWNGDPTARFACYAINNGGTRQVWLTNSAGHMSGSPASYSWSDNTFYTWMFNITTSRIYWYYDFINDTTKKYDLADSGSINGPIYGLYNGSSGTSNTVDVDYIAVAAYDTGVTNVVSVAEHKLVYAITSTANVNGSISPSGTVDVDLFDDQSFVVTPSGGYQLDTLLVNGIDAGQSLEYTFYNVDSAHSIEASFTEYVAPDTEMDGIIRSIFVIDDTQMYPGETTGKLSSSFLVDVLTSAGAGELFLNIFRVDEYTVPTWEVKVNIGGVWKTVTEVKVQVDDVWKDMSEINILT